MIENFARQSYQRWFVDPLASKIKDHISPHQITILAAILGVLVIPALLYQQTELAVLLLLGSGYCDTLDGTIARFSNRSTPFGTALDIIIDRMVEFAVIFGLWMVDPVQRSFACFLMLGSILLCITSFLVVGIFTPNTSKKGFHYSPGIMERAEAFIFFILMMCFPAYFQVLAWLFIGLVSLTAGIRVYQFYCAQAYMSSNL